MEALAHVEDMLLQIVTHLGYTKLAVLICVSCALKEWVQTNKDVICIRILRRKYDERDLEDTPMTWREWMCEQVIARNWPAFVLRVLMQAECFDLETELDKNNHQFSIPLACAVAKRRHVTVQCLLDSKADANAIVNCNWTCAQTTSALRVSIRNQDLVMVKMLVEHKADVHAKDVEGRVALHFASLHDEGGGIVNFLVESGACVDALDNRDRQAIHYASKHDSKEAVYELVKHRANLNARESMNGYTPLHLACQHSSTGAIEALLASGCDADAVSYNLTKPLHNVCCVKAAKLVLPSCDVNSTSRNGYVPLHFFAIRCESELVKLALNALADVNARDDLGMNALQLSIQHRASTCAVVRTLIEAKSELHAFGESVSVLDLAYIHNCHIDVIRIIENATQDK